MSDDRDSGAVVVPFGKYRGQPVELMLADAGYMDWVRLQPGLMHMLEQRHPLVFNIITIGAPQSEDTPEHNQLQVKFLEPAFQMAFLRAALDYDALERELRANIASTGESIARTLEQTIVYYKEQLSELGERKRKLLKRNDPHWLQETPAERSNWLARLEAEASEAEAAIQQARAGCPAFELRPPTVEVTFECGYDVDLKYYWRLPSHCRSEHNYYRNVRVATFPLTILTDDAERTFRVEIKPRLGDDFPAVLRQMRRNQHDPGFYANQRDVLLINQFDASVTLEQVRGIFAPYRVMTLAEVEAHRVP